MTVSSSTNRASYSGNGSTTVFAYGFKIFDQDDLTVILRAADGTETTQTITTHYTVSGVGSVSGGNVTFVTAPASGVTVVILREQPLTQGLDLVANDPFPSASFEDQLDKLTFMVQQHDEELGRAIKASRTNTLTGSEFTISAADRANKVFSFDSSGDLSVTQELGTFKGDWAASTAYVERDLVRDSSDGSIYIVTSAHTSSGSTPLDTNTNSSKYDAIFDVGAMIAGTVTMTGNLTVQGNTTLGNASSDSITMTGTAANLRMSTTNVTDILDEDTMSSDSATALATQQSIKAYVDSQVGASDTLTEILGNGNTTSGANIQMTTTDELQFRDTALKISSSADGQLDIDADTEIEITAPTVDINASTEVNISADLSVDTDTLHVDSTNDRVGINTTSPDRDLTVIGTGHFGATTAGVALSNSASVGVIYGMTSTGASFTDLQITSVGSASHLYFDADGTIGINNTSPNDWVSTGTKFVIGGGSGHNGMTIASGSTSDGTIYFADGTTGDALDAGYIKYNHQYDRLSFGTASALNDTIRITSAGDVGIGLTGDPSTKLEVNGTVTADGLTVDGDATFGDNDKAIFGAGSDLKIYHNGSNSIIWDEGVGNLQLVSSGASVNIVKAGGENMATFATDGAATLYFDNAAKIATSSTGISVTGTVTADGVSVDGSLSLTSTAPQITFIENDTTDLNTFINNSGGQFTLRTTNDAVNTFKKRLVVDHATGDISFYEDTGTTAKFFWDASAESLLVGKTASDTGTSAGFEVSSGTIYPTRSGASTANFNRLTSDGNIVNFRKDGTTVGSIGVFSSDNLGITGSAASHAGVIFGTNQVIPASSGTYADAAVDIGNTNNRFRDLYLSGGVYLGGVGSSNKLDDYEEGTWTPSLKIGGSTTGITYGQQEGFYIKVGQQVFVNFRLSLTSKGSSTGTAVVIGLPFSVADSFTGINFEYGGVWDNWVNLAVATTPRWYLNQPDGDIVLLNEHTTAGANSWGDPLTNSDINNTTDIRISFTYKST